MPDRGAIRDSSITVVTIAIDSANALTDHIYKAFTNIIIYAFFLLRLAESIVA